MPRQITVQELARILDAAESVLLLDVRQGWEHETARLPVAAPAADGAGRAISPAQLLIPLHELEERWTEVAALTGGLIVAYCHHGVRSLGAAAFLESKGIASVASLAGGIDAWSLAIDAKIPRY